MSQSAIVTALAGLAVVATHAFAHIQECTVPMNGARMVPPTDSLAGGSGRLIYNHHTFRFDLDLKIKGIDLNDLAPAGPNGTPIHIYRGSWREQGEIVVDLGLWGDFVQEADGIRLVLDDVLIGGQQGAFSSSTFENHDALYDFHLYVQVFTNSYPDGEIRGQIGIPGKVWDGSGFDSSHDLGGPPTKLPAPGGATLALALLAGLTSRRARRV